MFNPLRHAQATTDVTLHNILRYYNSPCGHQYT
jgi:hypothetical protein